MSKTVLFVLPWLLSIPALPQEVCRLDNPGGMLRIPYAAEPASLDADPAAAMWQRTEPAWIARDCTRKLDYPDLKTEVRAFWADTHLYLLFICPYRELHLWLPPQPGRDRDKLWDRDVVDVFLGDDWTNIRRYREFEIAPTGDRIDLAIDLGKQEYGAGWESGWKTA